jgi:O-antigen/teichoic acid export membrane protein
MNSKVNIQVVVVSLGKILAMLATFIVPVILTRYLSKEEYGIYGQFNSVFLFCGSFFSLGMRSNLFYFYPNSNIADRKILVFQTFMILFFLSIIASLFIVITPINSIVVGKNELLNYVGYIALALLFSMSAGIVEPLYILRRDNTTSLFYPVVIITMRAIVVVAFVLYISSIESVLVAINIVLGILFLFSLYYMGKELKVKNFKELINVKILKKQINYSLPFGLSTSLNAIITKLDKILCISYISVTEYAIYTVSFLAIPGIQAIYDSLVQVYIVEMSKAYNDGDNDKVIHIYQDLITKSFSYTLPAILIVFVFANFVITTLFTEKYIDAVPLFRLYMIGSLSMVLGAGIVLRSIGKTKLTLRSYVLSSFFTIPLTFYLVINFGLWGAMSSTIFALIFPKIFLFMFDIRELNTNIRRFFPWKNIAIITIISSLALIPVIIIHNFLTITWFNIIPIAFSYLFLVFFLEYKNRLFVVDNSVVEGFFKKILGFIKK